MRKTLETRCVYTMVLRLPILSARNEAPRVETAVIMFTTRKMMPRLPSDTP